MVIIWMTSRRAIIMLGCVQIWGNRFLPFLLLLCLLQHEKPWFHCVSCWWSAFPLPQWTLHYEVVLQRWMDLHMKDKRVFCWLGDEVSQKMPHFNTWFLSWCFALSLFIHVAAFLTWLFHVLSEPDYWYTLIDALISVLHSWFYSSVSVIWYIYVYLHVKWALKMAGPSLVCAVQMQHSPLYCDLLDILIELVWEWSDLKLIYDCRGVFFPSGTHLRLFHVHLIRINKGHFSSSAAPYSLIELALCIFAPKAGLSTVWHVIFAVQYQCVLRECVSKPTFKTFINLVHITPICWIKVHTEKLLILFDQWSKTQRFCNHEHWEN